MMRPCVLSLAVLTSTAPVFAAEPPRFGIAGTADQVELIGPSSYRVIPAGGPATRTLPRSGLLRLRYATFDPLSAESMAAAAVPERLKSTSPTAFIVQFHTPPLESYRAELRRLGATVHQFLPDEALLVRMNAAARARVQTLPFVRWVGAYEPAYKLEPSLAAALQGPSAAADPAVRYSILVLEKGAAMKNAVVRRIRALGGAVEAGFPEGHGLEASLTRGQLLQVAQMAEILCVDVWRAPEDDMDLAREISGANFLETVEGYRGQGVRGEVMDGGVRATHVDFRARPPVFHTSNSTSTGHGTSTYGQVFGDGTGSASARGLLPFAQGIFARQVSNRYAHTGELVDPARIYRAVFQSNSWGSGLTTQYTTTSAAMDDILFDHDILILQSQSNTGTRDSRPQAWAKNILSVGGIRHRNTLGKSDDAWGGGASIGPAADGRIKPDLAHFYDSIRTTSDASDTSYTSSFGGTSGATPIVAGYAGLLFQMWADGVFAGGTGQARDVFASRPHMSTAKALLINSAAQYPFTGPTHDLTRVHQGWGFPDVRNLYDLARTHNFRLPVLVDESAILRPFETHGYSVNLLAPAPLRATLVYADPMGSPSAARARINDLSLRVTSPSGAVYWGNNGLLDGVWSTPGGVSNKIDTVENVFVQSAASGTWKIEVLGDEIVQDGHVQTAALDADYALVVTTSAAVGGDTTIFFDDFGSERGWTRNPRNTDTATTGLWERGDPEPTASDGPKQLGDAASPPSCLVTGRLAGASAGDHDIDGGVTSIESPAVTLTGGAGYTLSFNAYLAHRTNSSADDFLRVRVIGSTAATVFQELGAADDDDAAWSAQTVSLDAFAGQTIRIVIEAADAAGGSLVEAAVDDVRVSRR